MKRCTKQVLLTLLSLSTLLAGCGSKSASVLDLATKTIGGKSTVNGPFVAPKTKFTIQDLKATQGGSKVSDPGPQCAEGLKNSKGKFEHSKHTHVEAEAAYDRLKSDKTPKGAMDDPIGINIIFGDDYKVRLKDTAKATELAVDATDIESKKLFIVNTERGGEREKALNKLLKKNKGIQISYVFGRANELTEEELDTQEVSDTAGMGSDMPNLASHVTLTSRGFSKEQILALYDDLLALDCVASAAVVPIYAVQAMPEYMCATVNDPYVPHDPSNWMNWGVNDQSWYFFRHSIFKAWLFSSYGVGYGSNTAKVVVIDGAFNLDASLADHPVWDTTRCRRYYDNYGSYYTNPAQLFINNNLAAHGTAVAYQLAARANNGYGTAGIDPNATIVPIAVDDDAGVFPMDRLSTALDYGSSSSFSDSKIISTSLGHPADETIPSFKAALDLTWARGKLCIRSAGNQGVNLPYVPSPSQTLVVGSIGAYNAASSFSNYGNRVDIFAAGELNGIFAPDNSGTITFQRLSGTSFSTPIVAGAAALCISQKPDMTNAQLRDCLVYSSDFGGADPNEIRYGAATLSSLNGPLPKFRILNAWLALFAAFESDQPYIDTIIGSNTDYGATLQASGVTPITLNANGGTSWLATIGRGKAWTMYHNAYDIYCTRPTSSYARLYLGRIASHCEDGIQELKDTNGALVLAAVERSGFPVYHLTTYTHPNPYTFSN